MSTAQRQCRFESGSARINRIFRPSSSEQVGGLKSFNLELFRIATTSSKGSQIIRTQRVDEEIHFGVYESVEKWPSARTQEKAALFLPRRNLNTRKGYDLIMCLFGSECPNQIDHLLVRVLGKWIYQNHQLKFMA